MECNNLTLSSCDVVVDDNLGILGGGDRSSGGVVSRGSLWKERGEQ